jgi:predicted protein tyrosine phosphatase
MQQRIAGRTGRAGTVTGLAARTYEKRPDKPSLRSVPTHPYIAYMSRNDCCNYDHTGSVVISITNPGGYPQPPEFPKALDVLYLEFNPTSSNENWIQTEHRDRLSEFLNKHVGKNIITHCGEGSIRSPSLSLGILEAANDIYCKALDPAARGGSNEFYKLYHFVGSRWSPKSVNDAYNDCYIDSRVQHVGYRSVDGRDHKGKAWHSFFETQGAATT